MTQFYELPYKARKFYSGNGQNQHFPIIFDGGAPLDYSHVKVFLNQSELTSGWTIVELNGTKNVRFDTAPASGTGNVMLQRVTPSNADDRVVDFSDGSVLTAEALDRAQLNSLYVSQESADLFLDQGGSAVNIATAQTILGEKTFNNNLIISEDGRLIYKPATPISKVDLGEQYVLAAESSTGVVGWQKTALTTIQDSIVQTQGPAGTQVITAAKQFDNVTISIAGFKVSGGTAPVRDKAIVAANNLGQMSLQAIVNGIKFSDSPVAPVNTGIVTITPSAIGAVAVGSVSGNTQTINTEVIFTQSVEIGDGTVDDQLTISGDLYLASPQAASGKVLGCLGSNGQADWINPPQTGITSINGDSGTNGVVTIDAADVGAVSVSQDQTVLGHKTFQDSVTLGNNNTKNVTVNGTLKYTNGVTPTGQAGKILTSLTDGTAAWGNLPSIVNSISTVNGAISGDVALTAADVGAVSAGTTQTITGEKTFTNNVTLGNTSTHTISIGGSLRIPVGQVAAGKVLTSDSGGYAYWASPAATGVTSVNNQNGPSVTLTAADVGAVSVQGSQEITGHKTFSNNVNLGVDGNDVITIQGDLRYPVGHAAGRVLTSTADGKAIWQTPEPAPVQSVNGQVGAVTISAGDLGAFTSTTLPIASASQRGAVRIGTGLGVDAQGIISVNASAVLPVASATVLGGIKVGSNLSINQDGVLSAAISQTTGVTTFNGRAGDVLPTTGDYTAAQVGALSLGNDYQEVTGRKRFSDAVLAAPPGGGVTQLVGQNGMSGVQLNSSGLAQFQRTTDTAHAIRVHAPAGGTTAFITSAGSAQFNGVVTAIGGFSSPAGMNIGDNTNDGINITGTLKIAGNGTPASGKVLVCTNTDGNVEWQFPANAPVQSVNGVNGAVSISADGEANPGANLNAVTKGTIQTITGAKTFSANTLFNANVTLGDNAADIATVNATLKIPSGAPAVGKVLTCSNVDGTASWSTPAAPPVTSIIMGGESYTGNVTISAATLGVLSTSANTTVTGQNTFSAPQTFSGGVTLGDALSDNITIEGTIKIPTNAGLNKVLTCTNVNGTAEWTTLAAPPVTSVNGNVGAVVLNAASVGAVSTSSNESISGNKTFSGTTTFAGTTNLNGSTVLGDAGADTIVVNGSLRIPAAATVGRVWTCSDAATGAGSWSTPPVVSVNTQTGAVVLTAADVGAPTIAALNAVSGVATQAATDAATAVTTASNALAAANTKLSSVAIGPTPIGPTASETNFDCLSGSGTAASPLKVIGAHPVGYVPSGDLTGSYPSPTVGGNKITYAKMQQVSGQKLLGNSSTTTANVTEIGLGTGLTWGTGADSGKIVVSSDAAATVTATGNNTFSGTNQFNNAVTVGTTPANQTLTVNGAFTATGVTTLGAAAAGTTIKGALKIEGGSPGANKVLTSDATGNATWATFTPPTGRYKMVTEVLASGTSWSKPAGVTFVEFCLVGGGGGGNASEGSVSGGQSVSGWPGGDGGCVIGSFTAPEAQTSYTYAIGGGGAGQNASNSTAGAGANSTAFGVTAPGGRAAPEASTVYVFGTTGGSQGTYDFGLDRDSIDEYVAPTDYSVSTSAVSGVSSLSHRAGCPTAFGLGSQRRTRAASSTAATAYSTAKRWKAGSGGAPGTNNSVEPGSSHACATGGVGGALAVRYIQPSA